MVLIKKKKKISLSADIFIKAAGSGCLCREVKKVKNKKNNRRLLCFNHFLFFFSFFFISSSNFVWVFVVFILESIVGYNIKSN